MREKWKENTIATVSFSQFICCEHHVDYVDIIRINTYNHKIII